jgi:hypothetical protein
MFRNNNNIYKHIITIIAILTVIIHEKGYGQCAINNYTLSPSGNICGTTTSITLSGSQVGVSYQLMGGSTGSIGNPVAGTGSAITWSNISPGTMTTYTVVASKSGCGSPVVAGTNITAVPPLAVSDVTITASSNVLYQGDSIIYTIAKSPTCNPQQTFAFYLLFDGNTAIGTTTTNNNIVVKTQSLNGGYSIMVNSATCGSTKVPCPSFITLQSHLIPGTMAVPNTNIAYNTSPGTMTFQGIRIIKSHSY